MIGRTISHYQILERLGAGGMGEVYLAEDTTLGRKVALKLVSAATAADPVARARLVREARLASSLNHPNICTIFEVGEDAGVTFIAMELAKGIVLAVAIPPDGLPVETCLRYGAEIAGAVAHAHEQGIIHRDLKSANVVIGVSGSAKVLDFGLAGNTSGTTTHESDATLTYTGSIAGTPAYMAPEVLRGERADERSDIWALGAMLYEMATGTLPFHGVNGYALSAAILKEPPSPLPARVPSGLRAVILRCLDKEPSRRFASAGEVRAALTALQSGLQTPAAEHSRAHLPVLRALLAALVVVVLAVALWMAWKRTRPVPELTQQQLTALSFSTAGNESGHVAGELEFGPVSPDGKSVAFASRGGLRIRSVESGESSPLALPDGFAFDGAFPVMQWFPDGTRLVVSGAMSDNTPAVWVIPTMGGLPHRISVDGGLATVSPDGLHVALIRPGKGGPEIWTVGPNGESPTRIVSSDSSGTITSWAAWSPRGQRLVYLCQRADRKRGVAARLESCDLAGHRVAVADVGGGTLPLWLTDGRVVFSQNDPPPSQFDMNLWALRVDPKSGAASGKPKRITQWQGNAALIPLSVSSDGGRMSVGSLKYQSDIYVGRVAGGDSVLQDVTRLTTDERDDVHPAWTPDSRAIVFASNRNSNLDVFEQGIDATEAQPLVTGPGDQAVPSITSDGEWVVYRDSGTPTSARIMRVPLRGGPSEVVRDAQPVSTFRRGAASDSTWVAADQEPGRLVFTRLNLRGGAGRMLGSVTAGVDAHWDLSPDGAQAAVVDIDSIPRIRVFTFRDRSVREVRLDRQVLLAWVSWSPDGVGWFVVSAGESGAGPWYVLRVAPNGQTVPLIPPQIWMYSCAPSPDGRYIAYTSNTGGASMWLLENF